MTYKWEALATATAETGSALGTTNSIMVSANEVGKFIKLTVTDAEGKTYTATTTSAVVENNTASVTVSIVQGAQADGTGIVGNTLHLSYGSGLGVPELITWYYNDTVAQSERADGSGITGMLDLATGGTILKDGKYYAVITNKNGETFTSNTIELVYEEQPIEISSAVYSDDYKTAANMVFDNKDTNAVITITTKKFYSGDLYVYEDAITNYTNTNMALKFANLTANSFSEKTAFDQMTEKNALATAGLDTPKSGLIYYAPNGETTIMLRASAATTPTTAANKYLQRGKKYKVAFDQAYESISDNITAVAKKDIKVTESSDMAYVVAPEKVELVTVAPGANVVVNVTDAEGNLLEFLGDPTTGIPTTGTPNAGFDVFKIMQNGKASETDATELVNGGTIKAGVFTSTDKPATVAAYNYAVVTTTPGVYGEDSVTLKSGFKAKNIAIAEKVTISEDSAVPAQANLEIDSLVAPAKIYVVSAQDLVKQGNIPFSADNAATYRGVVEVKPGDGTATVSNVFKYGDIGDTFTAYLVPDDKNVYAEKSSSPDEKDTQDGDAQKMTLMQVPTGVEYSSTKAADPGLGTATCGTTPDTITLENLPVVLKDQFNKDLEVGKYDAVTKKKAVVTAIDAGGEFPEAGTAVWDLTNAGAGVFTITITRSSGVDKGDGFKLTLLGKDFEVKALGRAATGITGTDRFGVKLGSDKLTAQDLKLGSSVNVADEKEFVTALASTDTTTINVTTGFPTTADHEIASTQTVNIAKDQTITIGAGKSIVNYGTITLATDSDATDTDLAGSGDLYQYGTLTKSTGTNTKISLTGKIYCDSQARVEQVAQGTTVDGAATVVSEVDFTSNGAETFTKKLIMAKGKSLTMGTGHNLTLVDADFTEASLISDNGTIALNGDVNLTGATFTNASGAITVADSKKVTMSDATAISGIVFTVSTTSGHTALFDNGKAVLTVQYPGTADIETTATDWPTSATTKVGTTVTITNASGTWTYLGTQS